MPLTTRSSLHTPSHLRCGQALDSASRDTYFGGYRSGYAPRQRVANCFKRQWMERLHDTSKEPF